jgi:hypothetical protein
MAARTRCRQLDPAGYDDGGLGCNAKSRPHFDRDHGGSQIGAGITSRTGPLASDRLPVAIGSHARHGEEMGTGAALPDTITLWLRVPHFSRPLREVVHFAGCVI